MLQSREQIGRFDREITFIEPTITDGDSNEDKITAWSEISSDSTVSARKIDLRGNEAVIADRETYFQTTKWVIRWRDDLNARMRLVHSTKVYQIISITEPAEGRQRFLEVLTTLMDNEFFT